MNRILVAGVPRSGTTWLANALAATSGAQLVHEPDNPAFHPGAAEAHSLYGGYAAPHVGEHWPAYEQLWDAAYRDGESEATSVIAKSVFAAFALDWIVDRYAPSVVVIERHPLRVVSSWMRLDFVVGDLATRARIQREYVEAMQLPPWDPHAARLVGVSWAVGVLMSVMRANGHSRSDWAYVSHEWLSDDRVPRLRSLADALNLAWSAATEQRVRDLGAAEPVSIEMDDCGIPTAWRMYPASDARAALAVLRRFPLLDPWFEALPS